MSITLKPYPEYKDSGVLWLGKIPKHWDASRLGTVLQERGENNADGHVEQVLSVLRDVGVILYEDKGNIGNKKSEDISRYKVVRPGDIVINCMNVIIGSVGLSRYTGCLSPVYYVLKTRYIADRSAYFNSVFRLKPFQQSLVRIGNGILAHRMRIPMELLKGEVIPRPHQEEQDAIVRFLAHADHRINRLIRAKRQLTELLNEQKQVIIHRAVTRGLALNVRLKPSGIGWLGEVPEHWDVWPIGHFAKVGNGSTPSRGNAAYWSANGYPWLNSASVNQGIITKTGQFVTDLALRECHLPRVQPGSVLVAITGQGKTRGTAAVLAIEATINQHMAYISPRTTRVSSDYLQMCLTAAYVELRAISDDSGSTKGALTCEDVKHFKVALPPTDEQDRLVCMVRQELADVEATLTRIRCEIDLLREYHTRLLADVVTGKLDVRDVELPALDEGDAMEDGETGEDAEADAIDEMEGVDA